MTIVPTVDDKTLDRLQKLANLAAKNSSPMEAASAAAKLQDELVRLNLDMAVVENAQAIKDGKREEAKVDGGSYKYQRELWKAVAELNFCLYWTQSYEVETNSKRVGSGRARYTTSGWVTKKRHALVGKIVNTRATIGMAGYLQAAIERLVVDRLHEEHGEDRATVNSQRFSNWAVSLRKGAARRVVEKLQGRRDALIEADLAKAAADLARAERAGVSTATTLTIADVRKAERAANIDFVYGDGTSAKWAAERAERARKEREADEAHTAWAAAHPLEAAAQAAKHRDRRRTSRGGGGRSDNLDRGAYWAGYDLADKIGIEQQAEGVKTAGALR